MSEKPILFSGEMVKAILDGRKWKTRRVITTLPIEPDTASINPDGVGNWVVWAPHPVTDEQSRQWYPNSAGFPCPYGKAGDTLWVRETWRRSPVTLPDGVQYRADNLLRWFDGSEPTAIALPQRNGKWRPSIFMPRWASRITLRITDVKVERLQDISEGDAIAEGVGAWHDTKDGMVYRPEFQALWDTINAKRGFGWDANPWVWVLSFERAKEVTP